MARRPGCECGTCKSCRDRAYARARRADPAFREADVQRSRAYRAAVRRDRLRLEAERARRRELYEANVADPDWRRRRNERERRRRARARERLAEAIEPGATAIELAERTGFPVDVLATVLASEVAAGRAIRTGDGRVCLLPSSFPPGVLDAIGALPEPDAVLANGNGGAHGKALLRVQRSRDVSHAVY